MLPNCIIAGVQKSATTWLQTQLRAHPDIYATDKEIHYFDRNTNYSRGKNWYESQFQSATNKTIIVDKTPGYFWTTCEAVPNEPVDKPKRMHDLPPDSKILVMFRDPAKRAISAWHHNIRSGRIDPKLSASDILAAKCSHLVEKHGILTRGLYHEQLKNLLEYYRREQVLLIFQEEILKDPIKGLNQVFDFLGVERFHNQDAMSRRENAYTPSQLATNLCYFGNSHLPVGSSELTRAIQAVDKRLPSFWKTKKLQYPKASSNTLQRLRAYYSEDVSKLSSEFGPVPDSWHEN